MLGKVVPFVGRERELALLEATYRECTDEPIAHATIMIAPPGTGKSRLQRELVARLSGGEEPPRVWIGLTDPVMRGAAFALAGDLFRRAIGLTEDQPLTARQQKIRARVSDPRAAIFLGEMVGAPFDDADDATLRAARRNPDFLASQIEDAVVTFVQSVLETKRKTLLIVLEDVHWADAASVRLFGALLARLRESPIMVLALARPSIDESHPKLWEDVRCQRIVLEPLLRRAAERLARAVLGEEAEVGAIVRRAAGNALFVEELARACAEGRAASELPPTVAAAAEARIGALDTSERQALRASSVFGERFWLGGIARLLGVTNEDATARLKRLEQLEVVSHATRSRFADQPEYVFRHALVRDAAYAMLTDDDRRLGHDLAAQWLEERIDDAAVLAHHYELGDRKSEAVRWHVKAAENALAANDFDALASHVERAEACGAARSLLGSARLAAAEGASWKSDFGAAAKLGDEARKLIEPGTERWFQAMGTTAAAYGRLESYDAVREIAIALERVPATEERTGRARAIARARIASQLAYGGEPALTARLLDGCENEPGAKGDPAVLAWLTNAEIDRKSATAFGALPSLSLHAMRLYENVRAYDAVTFASTPRGRVAQRVGRSVALASAGLWEEQEDLDELVAASSKTPVYHSLASSVRARALAARGDGATAVAVAEEASALAKERGVAHWGPTSIDIALVTAYEAASRPRALETAKT